VYGVRNITDKELSGGHVRAMMASAPFPIPIDMKDSSVFDAILISGGNRSRRTSRPRVARSASSSDRRPAPAPDRRQCSGTPA